MDNEKNVKNIVQVYLMEDIFKKRYTYNVPFGKALKKGDVVKVKDQNGGELAAICATDSKFIEDDIVDMIMCGNAVLSGVIGIYRYESYTKTEEDTIGDKT